MNILFTTLCHILLTVTNVTIKGDTRRYNNMMYPTSDKIYYLVFTEGLRTSATSSIVAPSPLPSFVTNISRSILPSHFINSSYKYYDGKKL